MKWEIFKSELRLDKAQAKEIKNILECYKDQYTDLCLHPSREKDMSPIEYAVKLKVRSPQMNNDTFSKEFLCFLSTEKDSVSNLSYVDAGLQFDLLVREKINHILQGEQKVAFQAIGIDSMLDIVTNYDPFWDKLAKHMAAEQNLEMGRNDNYCFSKTFCILPWIHTFVEANSEVKLCCFSSEGLIGTNSNLPLNLEHQTFREIWNSAEMREIRRRMLSGEKVKACSKCDRETDIGQSPGRDYYNKYWLIEDSEREKWKRRVKDSMKNNFQVHPLPVYYDLRPGNICNLKCRMCNTDYSNKIGEDSVQNQWAYKSPDIEGTRFSDESKWYEVDSVLMDNILENIQETRIFYLSGGEPLINPFIKKLIDVLIECNVSQKIELQFSTNLTVFPEVFFRKLTNFKSVRFYLSIDGFGPVYEYIRYPAKWKNVVLNLQNISKYANFSCIITPTIQNYNILTIVDLLEYAESLNLTCNFNILYNPRYLSIRVMPLKARMLAVKRLTEYMKKSPMVKKYNEMATSIHNTILELKQDTEEAYHETIHEFMVFTNDLDKSRKQVFKDTLPEFYNFIVEDGFAWTTEKRHTLSKGIRLEMDNVEALEWEELRTRLKLDESKAVRIKKLINNGKDQFVKVCIRKTADNKMSPFNYATKLRTGSTQLEEVTFRKKFMTYLLEKNEPVANLSYLETGHGIDLSIEEEVNKLLSKEESKLLEASGMNSFLYIKTGYDPLEDKLSERIQEKKMHRIAKRRRQEMDNLVPLEWEELRTRLKLDESKTVRIKKLINNGKDQFVKVCIRKTADNKMSPFEYATKLSTGSTQLEEGTLRKKFMTYLYDKREPVTRLSYLEAGHGIDLSITKEISKLLSKKERELLEASEINSFLHIKTEYDPLVDILSERIHKTNIRMFPKIIKKEIDNAKDVEWEELRTRLKLDESKAVRIKKLINNGKNQFVKVCIRKTADNEMSPFEYAVKLKTGSMQLDEGIFKKKFLTYLSGKKEPVTGLSYLDADLSINLSIRKDIDNIINRTEKSILDKSGISSFLYIKTGHNPLEDKLSEQIQKRKFYKFAKIKSHRFNGYFCPFPFDYITVCDNGDVYLCSACRMHTSVGNINRNSLLEIWNSENAVKVREAIFDGSYKFCNEKECELLQDHKLGKNEEFTEQFYKGIISKQLTKLKTNPRTIEISYDKSCNLSCPCCRQENIICDGDEFARLNMMQEKISESGLRGVKRLMISGCGDPLASKIHRDFLQNFDHQRYPDLRIKLQTNGLLLTPDMWDMIEKSHYAIDWISISIDAATKETYRITRGGNFDKLLRNLEFVSDLRRKKTIETFNINFVVQTNNFREMRQFIELGKRYSCDYIVFQRIMNLGVDYGMNSERKFQELAIHLKSHPMHKEFLEALKDPIFMDSRIGLFKLLEFFPDNIKESKDVDSIIRYYPENERKRSYR